jgi:segregation and condensation protein B
MEATEIKHFVESALLAAGRPLNIDQLKGLFDGRTAPEKAEIRQAIATLNEEYEERGIVISEVASGFRIQVKSTMADRLHKLWEDRPPRYSRALFETLALIAYRQPITRGDIEEIRGVTVSSNIVRQLLERDWIRVVGHRDVPGRPAMFGTTKAFLDYFSLKKLDDLPPLADLSDWESLRVQLNLPDVEEQTVSGAEEVADAATTDLPVLYPEEIEEDEAEYPGEDEVADALVKAEAVNNIPELRPIAPEPEVIEEADGALDRNEPGVSEESAESEEDLVVSKWPDPVG